jgi:L-rhamnose isomerase/sugar isomerase
LGTGGTRFARYAGGGEPRNLEEKIEDIGLLHALNGSSGAISLHIPWDIPENPAAIRKLASQQGIRFDAMNSNTFQDQPGQQQSYKFGSLHHVREDVREQAIQHNLEVIRYGEELWFQIADGLACRRFLFSRTTQFPRIFPAYTGKSCSNLQGAAG